MEETKTVQGLPLLGDPAPAFKANTTHGPINFPEDYKGKWVILFSHPADFTPVCTTEFIAFARMFDEFQALNTELLGLSVDSITSHVAWVLDIEKLNYKGETGTQVQFPIIDDIKMTVATKYGMIQPSQSTTAAVRAVFIIDPKGIVRTILYYPLSLGRNFDELKRIIQALQKADADSVATPADWRPGDDVIIPINATTEVAKGRLKNPPEGAELVSWYLALKKDK